MKAIKLTLLATVATVACIGLWPTFQPVNEPVTNNPATAIAQPGRQTAQQQIDFTWDRTSAQLSELPTTNAAPVSQPRVDQTTVEKDVEKHLILYPELARIRQLENQSVDRALDELLPMLSSDDPVVRVAVIRSLGDIATPAALPALTAALDDPIPQLRVAVLEELTEYDRASVTASIEPSLFDSELEVRLAAIEALAILESPAAVYSLTSLLSDENAVIRLHALNALEDIGGEDLRMYLQQARYDSHRAIRGSADAMIRELDYQGLAQ